MNGISIYRSTWKTYHSFRHRFPIEFDFRSVESRYKYRWRSRTRTRRTFYFNVSQWEKRSKEFQITIGSGTRGLIKSHKQSVPVQSVPRGHTFLRGLRHRGRRLTPRIIQIVPVQRWERKKKIFRRWLNTINNKLSNINSIRMKNLLDKS